MESSVSVSVEEKLRLRMTYYRVPLLLIPFAALAAYIHNLNAFFCGAAVAVLGQAIQTWAGSHLHKDERLTISGPYSHVRNPMYIGRFVLMLGFVLMVWNPWITAVYVVLFAAYAHTRVLREEERLKEIFQPGYQQYCEEIHRWLPRLRPYSGRERRGASWTQIRFNNEDIHFAVLILVLELLYLRIRLVPLPLWPF